MADKNGNVAESITIEPNKTSQIVNNVDKMTGNQSAYQAALNKSAEETRLYEGFFASKKWRDYISDPARTFNKRNAGLYPLEKLSNDPLWKTSIDQYGEAIANYQQEIHSVYGRAENWWDRMVEAYQSSRYGLRVSAARKDLSDAITKGDPVEIARRKLIYETEQEYAQKKGRPYEDDYNNTIISLATSMARNPESIVPAVVAVGVVAGTTAATGGAAAPAWAALAYWGAKAVSSGIVAEDTFRTESGSVLEELDREQPDMPEEDKRNLAVATGAFSAALEAIPFAGGVGVLGRGVKGLTKPLWNKVITKTITDEVTGKVLAKNIAKPAFLKELKKGLSSEAVGIKLARFVGETAVDASIEGMTEVIQDEIHEAAIRTANGEYNSLSSAYFTDLEDFIKNPFAPQHADKWETFINVALSSPIFSVGFAGANKAVSYGVNTFLDKANGMDNNVKGLKSLFSRYKDKSNPEKDTILQTLKTDATEGALKEKKLYISAEQAQIAMQDPEVADALLQMGYLKGKQEANEEGKTVVELDLVKYDEIVNKEQNETLFQKISQYLSFSETTMSADEFNKFIHAQISTLNKRITDAVKNDPNSDYNRALKYLNARNFSEEIKEGCASLFYMILDSLRSMGKNGNDIANRLTLQFDTRNEDIEKAVAKRKELYNNFSKLVFENAQDVDAEEVLGDNYEEGALYVVEQEGVLPAIIQRYKDNKYTYVTEYGNFDNHMYSVKDLSKAKFKKVNSQLTEQYLKENDFRAIDVTQLFQYAFAGANEGLSEAEQVLHMFLPGNANFSGMSQKFQDRVAKANEMMANGATDEEIFKETHFHKAADGKLRIQISDSEATVNMEALSKPGTYTLEQVLDHDMLFEAMPSLRNVKVVVDRRKGGSYNYSTNTIHIGLKSVEKERLFTTILHETQHAVQYRAGFAPGGASSNYKITAKWGEYREIIHDALIRNGVLDYWGASVQDNSVRAVSEEEAKAMWNTIKEVAKNDKDLADNINEIEKYLKKTRQPKVFDKYGNPKIRPYAEVDHKIYLSLLGEVESRLTEKLSTMTQEELDKIDPYNYLDVTRVIVKDPNTDELLLETGATENTQKTGEFYVSYDPELGRAVKGRTKLGSITRHNGSEYTFSLSKQANEVTFVHEMFHLFSLELQRLYNNGQLTDYWMDKAVEMFRSLGREITPGERIVLSETEEERLANQFTTYILQNKMPTKETRSILSRMVGIFKVIYKQWGNQPGGIKPYALNDKVIKVFDSIFETQEEAEQIQRIAGILEIPKPDNVPQDLYDYYIDSMYTSRAQASAEMLRKIAAIEEFKKSVEYKNLYQAKKDKQVEILKQDYRYEILQYAGMYKGLPVEEIAEHVLIDYVNEDGMTFTKEEIINVINNTPNMEEEATRLADQEMEDYISRKFKIDKEQIGFKEERNNAKVRALVAEYVMLKGGTLKDIEEILTKVKDTAEHYLGKLSVKQVSDDKRWTSLEAAAVDRYAYAIQTNNKDLAAGERFNQAVITSIRIRSKAYANELKRCEDLFAKLQSKQKKYRRTKDGREYGALEYRYRADDWELLRSISEKFGNVIKDTRRSDKEVGVQMSDWIDNQLAVRFTTVEGLREFIPFVNKGHIGTIQSMKCKDFKKLWTIMRTIDSISNREMELYYDGQYEALSRFVSLTAQHFADNNMNPQGENTTWWQKFFGKLGNYTNPEPVLSALFPQEVMNKIWLPLFNGAIIAENKSKLWISEYRKAAANVNLTVNTHTFSNGVTLKYCEIADLMLALGAKHSYENYKKKFNLTDDQVDTIASETLKEQPGMENFMRVTGKLYGEATEILNNEFIERRNELLTKKDHRQFSVNGIDFNGWYVPEDKHYLNQIRSFGEWRNSGMQGEYKNEKEITKQADGNCKSIIDITETKLSQSAKWGYVAIPWNNAKKFLETDNLKDIIGDGAFAFIADWMDTWDKPHNDPSGMIRPLTGIATVSALGLRFSTALMQMTGFFQAIPLIGNSTKVGAAYVRRGILQAMREGALFKPFKVAASKSDGLKARLENPFSAQLGLSVDEMLRMQPGANKLTRAGKLLLKMYMKAAMSMIQLVDGWVSISTWNGAYRYALDTGIVGNDIEARRYADNIVRRSQSDASEISRSKAMQEPWTRAVTAFGTWIMAMQSQSKAYRIQNNKKKYTVWVLGYVLVSSLFETFLKEQLKSMLEDDYNDDEFESNVYQAWFSRAVEAVGTSVFPFMGLGGTAAKMGVSSVAEGLTGEELYGFYSRASVPAFENAYNLLTSTKHLIKYGVSVFDDTKEGQKAAIGYAKFLNLSLGKELQEFLEE